MAASCWRRWTSATSSARPAGSGPRARASCRSSSSGSRCSPRPSARCPRSGTASRIPSSNSDSAHLHLATDPDARRRLVDARADTLRAIRAYLDEHGYVEVETPVLQTIAGGAMARPFVTHHRVLDMDLYLRISLELHLKRLLVGGLERVYEIGRNFRNEGIGRKYNPEFTMLELYQAYADYETMMEVTRDLVQASALAVAGSLQVSFRGSEHRSRRAVAPRDGARERVRGRRRGGHARTSGSRRARGAPRRAGRPVLAFGQDRARAVREARRARVDPADVRHGLPARGVTARAAAPRRPPPHRARRPGDRRDGARDRATRS